MRNATVPHADDYCRDVVVNAIKQRSDGLTLRELKQQLPPELQMSTTSLRRLVDTLEEDKVVESEQYQTLAKVYFLYGRTPRVRVRRVSATDVPVANLPPCNWFSSLGSVACQ